MGRPGRARAGDGSAGRRELSTARELCDDLVARLEDPYELARARLLRGEALLRMGSAEAAVELGRASAVLDELGARYWLVGSLLLSAEAEPERASEHLARARAATLDDPAFEQLWRRRPHLRIAVLGAQSVTVGDEHVRCRSRRSELLVLLLAVAGDDGLSADELCEMLWSDAALVRCRPRLRTALWDARVALGPEAWRLRREGERVHLDLEGAAVDLHEAARVAEDPASTSEARAGALAQLAQPLLPAWSDAPWAAELDEHRVELVSQVRGAW